MRPPCSRLALIVCAAACALATAPGFAAVEIAGIEYATGRIYRIPTDGSAPTLIAQTGVQTIGAFEQLNDGSYYGITHDDPRLYRFDPLTFVPTLLGRLVRTDTMFEGAIVQSPSGTVYVSNGGDASSAQLLTLDLTTLAVTPVGRFRPTGDADVNGLAWRSDGKLVGLDRGAAALVEIDPATGAQTVIRSLPFAIGAVGGMTLLDSVGYFVTAGPDSIRPGNNSLYSFDPFTGEHAFVRSFADILPTGDGFGGLAYPVPEPASAALLATLVAVACRRRRGTESLLQTGRPR
jgi:hypothetical protein